MSQDETRISEDEARALWRRAAELQADAARRLEERSRQLAPRDHPSDTAEADGYRLADVRAAAEDAGISPEFVDHALVESRNRALVEGGQSRPSAMAARFLGQPPRTLEVSRVIHAPAEEVYTAMQRVLPEHPYRLTLVDHHGADPVDGGMLVFKVPAFSYTTTADQSFAYEMNWADLRQLVFSLRRLDTSPPATELTVQASLTPSHRTNMWVGGIMSGIGAALGGVGGAFVGGAAAVAFGIGGVAVGAAALGFLAGGASFGGLAMLGYRKLYRYALRRGEKAIRDLLGAIAVDIDTGGGFSSPKPLPGGFGGFLREGREP